MKECQKNRVNGILHQKIIFNSIVMYQKASHNNSRRKEGGRTPPKHETKHKDHDQLCLEHSSPLELICFSCGNRPVCTQCLVAQHGGHQIRGVERSRSLLHGQYQEWIIRLASKSEILDVFHEQFEEKKHEISAVSKHFKEKVKVEFESIIKQLQDRLDDVLGQIDGHMKDYIMSLSSSMEEMRGKRKQIEKIVNRYDRQSIDNVSVRELAVYSYNLKDIITDILDQSDVSSYKIKLGDPQWGISNESLRQLKKSIENISVVLRDQRRSSSQAKTKKYRGKNEEGNASNIKLRNSNSNTLLQSLSPINKSKQKRIKRKKSPEIQLLKKRKRSAKMISMPASPTKQVQSTFLITPQASRKRLFKKK